MRNSLLCRMPPSWGTPRCWPKEFLLLNCQLKIRCCHRSFLDLDALCWLGLLQQKQEERGRESERDRDNKKIINRYERRETGMFSLCCWIYLLQYFAPYQPDCQNSEASKPPASHFERCAAATWSGSNASAKSTSTTVCNYMHCDYIEMLLKSILL